MGRELTGSPLSHCFLPFLWGGPLPAPTPLVAHWAMWGTPDRYALALV